MSHRVTHHLGKRQRISTSAFPNPKRLAACLGCAVWCFQDSRQEYGTPRGHSFGDPGETHRLCSVGCCCTTHIDGSMSQIAAWHTRLGQGHHHSVGPPQPVDPGLNRTVPVIWTPCWPFPCWGLQLMGSLLHLEVNVGQFRTLCTEPAFNLDAQPVTSLVTSNLYQSK